MIRRVTIADIDALRKIDAASFAVDDQYAEAFYMEALTTEQFNAIGIVERNSLVAWALVDTARTPMRIRSLAVHPQFRRRGCATALIEAIVASYAAAIDLLVEPENAAAIALYERMGFRMTSPDVKMPQRLRMVREPA